MGKPRITVQGTPNPNAAKFTVDRIVVDHGSRSYFDRETAAGDALAERLFEIDGVRALFMVEDFVTVTKAEDADWDDLVQRVEEVIASTLSEASG